MLIVKPDYYNEFKCIAENCPDTCCAGWQIVIDEDSLQSYANVQGDFESRLKKSIDWDESVFCQDEEKRCAFLNDGNLCDLYTALGEGCLCKTCREYPRHIEEFENVREYTLSLSCPEVARILLNKKEPVAFLEIEEAGEEEFEDFDALMYDRLLEAREVMLGILQNRNLDISVRAYLLWEMGRELQKYTDEGMLFSCEEIFEKYKSEQVCEELSKQLINYHSTKMVFEKSLEYYKKLYELELLREDWDEHLQETAIVLYGEDEKTYRKLHESFTTWQKQYKPDFPIILEQLLVYFVQTYFCGAVYDDYILSKVKMSVVSTWMIYEMLVVRWFQNGQSLEMDDVISIVYRYSRELEHSDYNLETMEELLDEN